MVVETKLDGWRAIVTVDDGRLKVRSRRGTDLTASLPELQCLTALDRTTVLGGELVVGGGRLTDFYGLLGRLNMRMPTAASERVAFMAFDVLWLDDQPTIGNTYLARRELLEGLALGGTAASFPAIRPRTSTRFSRRPSARAWKASSSSATARRTAPERGRGHGPR